MTARQEAAVALREAFERPLPTDAPFEERLAGARYARALDAIPDDVLARYAIERGALIKSPTFAGLYRAKTGEDA